jgi:hypothetical protein
MTRDDNEPYATGEYDSRGEEPGLGEPELDEDDEPQEDIPQDLTDAANDLLDAMAAFSEAMHHARGRESALPTVRRFASYHLADLEGKDHGWLGSTLLCDDLRELYELGLEASGRRVDEEGR